MSDFKEVPEFGIKRENEERRDGGCGVVFDPMTQKYAVYKLENGRFGFYGGGVDLKENIKNGILREITEESGLYDFLYVEKMAEALCHFHNVLKNVNRVAYATCFLVILKSSSLIPTKLEKHEKFTLAWATPEEILSNWESHSHNEDRDHWRYFLKKSINRAVELGYDKSNTFMS